MRLVSPRNEPVDKDNDELLLKYLKTKEPENIGDLKIFLTTCYTVEPNFFVSEYFRYFLEMNFRLKNVSFYNPARRLTMYDGLPDEYSENVSKCKFAALHYWCQQHGTHVERILFEVYTGHDKENKKALVVWN